MFKSKRAVILFMLIVATFVLPATVLANKQAFKARLTTDAELHEVVDSSASGNGSFVVAPDGVRFYVAVRNLSGPVTGAHIHGPATESENAPVVATLCGGPAPAAVASCVVDSDGTLIIEGYVTASLLQGMTAPAFIDNLNNGLLYVNVHTQLNPAGEVRGQIYPR